MLRRTLIALSCSGLLAGGALAADETKPSCCAKKAKETASEPAPKLRCTLTGKTVDKCCCVEREGKTHCTLADKDVATCCCKPVAGEAKTKSEK